ncbi:hypothetical protein [Mycobacterium angelicum]|uniref:Low molecular weight antigen MTB12-like C-terminal domain-containing protein n=1 Tax=Mycobacterium angelicum TaxID=470074 RepID=A0A1W9ZNE6_MYCAN|nr:hypothetical protein [Mycobacterium angelicum]MCV7199484.1 hypothetical protein [Mycobacterium angelicum]ORA19329.1 hypothetical protein BST12_17680 [Mycobacterium angelicum]
MKTIKSIATGAVAVAAIGAAAAGVTSIASFDSGAYEPVVFSTPLPLDPAPNPAPAANLPTAAQLTGLLNSLADPSVSFTNKGNLVEGGIGGTEAHLADHELKKAAKNGDLPLSFTVTNIQPAAEGSATADVSVSGPKLSPPVTQSVTFVNQGSWMLSRSSAMQLLQAAGH